MVDGEPVRVRFAVPVTFRLPREDQGQALPPQRPPVTYSGLDVALLEPDSRRAFWNTLGGLPSVLAQDGTPTSEVEVAYAIGPDGRVRDTQMSGGPSSLRQMAAFLLGTVAVKEGRRPPTSWEGTFRLAYRADA